MAVERADEGSPVRPARLRAEAHGARVYLSDWRALLEVVPECDLLCVDAPYSDRVHDGHAWSNDGLGPLADGGERRGLDYGHWTPDEVRAFVQAWHPRARGWFATITDHVLGRAWEDELRAVGRYVFAPIPIVTTGATCRFAGDGPSSWTAWLIVARPQGMKWRTTRGHYELPQGQRIILPVAGGKQPWHLQQIVEDYSNPGDLVCDPCCGAGTALIAAIRCGLVDPSRARRAVGGDIKPEHVDLAATWIQAPTLETPRGQKVSERQMELIPRKLVVPDEERI